MMTAPKTKKARVRIPKGTVCEDGKVCESDLSVVVDVPDPPSPTMTTIPQATVEMETPQAPPPPSAPAPAPPPPAAPEPDKSSDSMGYTMEQLRELLPKGVNFAKCKGKNCDNQIIKSKKFTRSYKKCPICGCNQVEKNADICPCCGKSPSAKELEEDNAADYWDESDIEFPNDDEEEEDEEE